MKDVRSVLVVCTGNSCRSIMAEAYMRKRFAEESMDIDVKSAGTFGMDGMQPTAEALKILEINEIESGDLGSKPLRKEDIEAADVVLVMEPMHKTKAIELAPGSEDKVFYLGKFNPEGGDIVIPDPIGRPLAFYRASFRVIRQSVEGFIKWLKE